MIENLFIHLSKLVPVFVLPLGLALAVIGIGVGFAFVARHRLAATSAVIAGVWLWIASTPMFSEWTLGALERQYPPLTIADLPQADVAIVLGGSVAGAISPRVTLDLGAAADRVLIASRMHREGKVAQIIVSDGALPWLTLRPSQGELIRDLLIEWGVPAKAILITNPSGNTYQEALNTRLIRERLPFESALLITSASHMPRAVAVFRHAGLPVVAATVDVKVVTAEPWTVSRWLPDATALMHTTEAVKERIGWLAYRSMGYL